MVSVGENQRPHIVSNTTPILTLPSLSVDSLQEHVARILAEALDDFDEASDSDASGVERRALPLGTRDPVQTYQICANVPGGCTQYADAYWCAIAQSQLHVCTTHA